MSIGDRIQIAVLSSLLSHQRKGKIIAERMTCWWSMVANCDLSNGDRFVTFKMVIFVIVALVMMALVMMADGGLGHGRW